MPALPEQDLRPMPELHRTTPEAIVDHVRDSFELQVRVQFAPPNELITIPDGWHGAGKEGEVLVHVGDMLTKPISGTELPAADFLSWSLSQRFSLVDSEDNPVAVETAVAILEGPLYSWGDNRPVLRLTRTGGEGQPVEIQFYGGATNPWIETLSKIGNKSTAHITLPEQEEYRTNVRQLFRPFISRGSKAERARLGLAPTVDVLRRVDDCAASMVTIIGDQIIDDKMQISRDNLLEIHDLSVATTQAIVLAITMAERRHVPLLMRIGAPAFGLGSESGLNYIMNTLAQMKTHGPVTVGDMGTFMDEGDSATAAPKSVPVRQGDASRELRLFLGGGLPVSKMLAQIHDERGKPIGWDLTFRRASRVDNGPEHWAVLVSGTNLTVRTARRDKSFVPPGTELVNHENEPWFVGQSGLWASLGTEEGGLIPVTFVDRGDLKVLYLPAKARLED
ncbi:MAG: hypothetical protein ACOY0S_03825 [Patescibacteria group bacterium]